MFNGQTVLLVDDDPTQLLILSGYFQGLCAGAVLEAGSAIDALDMLRQPGQAIDLIVSDLMMPDMDGIELLRELKHAGYDGKLALISSLNQAMVNSARKLGDMHGLNIIGTCRKPLRKAGLDALFLAPDMPRGNLEAATNVDFTAEQITAALENGAIRPFYQPKVDVKQKRITGAEALVRWLDPERGVLTPAQFLPAVEQLNMSSELTFALMKAVFRDIASWKRQGLEVKTAVNVTAGEIGVLELPDRIGQLLRDEGIEASDIAIEITENAVLEFNTDSLEVLSRLRLMGIDIAIDDFGTGFANIKSLKEYPFSELKIDQSFVRGMTDDPFSQETVRAAVTLGRQMNMRLLAEGIETAEEWEFVRKRGVDEVQGFLIAKPMPVEEFVPFCLRNDGLVSLPPVSDLEDAGQIAS
ncbi:EAL domain-containing response regulator [Nitratireductor sp. XY-223]|uniref:EAL domain-containing response regulator n=1 Tax=Nitratireductor sp. XY-223 TaxID=2561926 RepID=UPI0010AA3575|nr:EAL domain-containing response regulator [Nitratireductor sp. XY-223]